MDMRLARSVAISVARGMAYLHSRQPPILHKARAPAPTKRLGNSGHTQMYAIVGVWAAQEGHIR